MELTWIEDFLALSASGNFSAAADQRASTQPAFSRRIRQLEEWLGIVLFDREQRPVRLTPAGQKFLPRAQHIRSEIVDARRASYVERSNFAAPTRVFTTGNLAVSLAPQVFADKQISHASLIVASVFGCIDAIRKGQADHALIPVYEKTESFKGLQAELIVKDSLQLVATSAVARRVALKGKTLSGPLLAYMPSSGPAELIAHQLEKTGHKFDAPPVVESASAEALLALARAGHGAAWLPAIMLDKSLLPVKATGLPKIRYDILWLSRKGAPGVQAAPAIA